MHVYKVQPRSDKRRFDLISDVLSFRSPVVWRAKRSQQRNPLRKVSQRSHHAVIRVYDEAGKLIATHEHSGDFREF